MIVIKIGTAEREDGGIDARWITDQVNARRGEGNKFCVLFKINCGSVNLNLPSNDYPTSGGGRRRDFRNRISILGRWFLFGSS